MKVLALFGPTGVGKTDVALAVAELLRERGEDPVAVSCDALQVYRGLEVLTGAASPEERERLEHRLLGVAHPSEEFSAGRFAQLARNEIDALIAAGRRPIIVGGTGLYFKTLTEGLSPIPAVPDDVRAHWRSEAARQGPMKLHAVLAARDREMAERLEPADTQRVVRALEVLEATGVSLAEWQRLPRQPILDLNETIPLSVSIDRDVLAERIDKRFAQMVEEGALDEALQLKALNLDPTWPVMLALGVAPLMRHLAGEITREEAIEMGAAETRQYAKRQRTWLRGNMIAWRELLAQEMETSAADFVSFIQSAH